MDLGGNSIENVKAIISASGNWRIEEDGKLVVKEVEAESLNVKNKAKFGTPENPQGITIYDEDTREPLCVKAKGGILNAIAGECGN